MVTAIRAARMFDGWSWDDGPAQVLVSDGRVLEVGRPGPVAQDVEVRDLGEVTLLPGLVDAHTHLTWDATPEAVARVSTASPEELLAQARRAATAALAVGITTVRDLGDREYVTLGLREDYRANPAAGPEIVASGPPVTIRGGHCGFLGGEAETPQELTRAVADRVERGIDVVKVMATGGEMTPGGPKPYESQYDLERLTVLAEAAHRAGLPITAHAHGAAGAVDAVLAGFDCIEHAGFWTEASAALPPGALESLLDRGTIVVATPAGRGLLNPQDAPPAIAARITAIQGLFMSMREAGVPMAYASDAGIGPVKPHDVLPYSLPRAMASGLDCVQALRAMTSVAAQACGLADRKGRIAKGYDADLLAVDGDPRLDGDALGRTAAVFRCGEPIASRGPALDRAGRTPPVVAGG